MSWGVGFCESPHMGFTSTAVHCCRSLFASLFSPTILPERLARCLDSWAEPQQVYRLQFRGLAATRAGDGRVMRPCTTQRGARHKSRQDPHRAFRLTKGPGLGRQSLSYQTESMATATIKVWTVACLGSKVRVVCPAIKLLTKLPVLGLIKGPAAAESVITGDDSY